MAKRNEFSDETWAVVADLFTAAHARDRPRSSDRLMLDGVLWVLCSGAAWRDMPERFGSWATVYHRFRIWRNCGAFDQMLRRLHLKLNDRGMIDSQTWMIDSTAVRAPRASSTDRDQKMGQYAPIGRSIRPKISLRKDARKG